jgi:hypothetical protein
MDERILSAARACAPLQSLEVIAAMRQLLTPNARQLATDFALMSFGEVL